MNADALPRRLVALVVFLVVLGAPHFALPDRPPPPGGPWSVGVVKNFVGRPIAELQEGEVKPLLDALQRLDPTEDRARDFFRYAPLRVWELGHAGERPVYLVLESQQNIPHPGASGIRLTLFDRSGAIRAK